MDGLADMKVVVPTEGRGPDEPEAYTHHYGYGLTLYLDDDQLEKLGITEKIEAGTAVTIHAKGLCQSSREEVDVQNGKDVSASIQITHMSMERGGVQKDAAAILYPNHNK